MKTTVVATLMLVAMAGSAFAVGEAGKVVAVIRPWPEAKIFHQYDETGAVRICNFAEEKDALKLYCGQWIKAEPFPPSPSE